MTLGCDAVFGLDPVGEQRDSSVDAVQDTGPCIAHDQDDEDGDGVFAATRARSSARSGIDAHDEHVRTLQQHVRRESIYRRLISAEQHAHDVYELTSLRG